MEESHLGILKQLKSLEIGKAAGLQPEEATALPHLTQLTYLSLGISGNFRSK